jgi:hypothetical protein
MATTVSTAAELTQALASGETSIEVQGEISGMPMITIGPGVSLNGGSLRFSAKGVRLTSDNTLTAITITTAEHELAILNDTTVSDLGTITLRDVTATGQVQLLIRDSIRAGHIEVDGLNVVTADLRGRMERPHGFGVDAMQGAFTVWNQQADPAVQITSQILNVSAGTAATPVRGSGVFVGGHGDWNGMADGGGVLNVSTLSTGEIHTDGGIAPGTPDLISGGVFVISGAFVENVINQEPVTTNGQNDMVLDNWGSVQTWTAKAPVTSNGPSGIGFVNFGHIDLLDVQAPIETNGPGARGFNVYDGSLREARFASIATHGDGSVGVQVSKDLPILEIAGDLTTGGGEGTSLVKGVQVVLKAIALSIKPGGHIGSAKIGGKIATAGDGVTAVEFEGHIETLAVTGGITTTGADSDGVHIIGADTILGGITITATGKDLVHS